MKNIRYISTVFFLLLVLFLAGCNPDGPGIFYTVATEQKINTSELSDKAVYGIVSAGSRIYVLAGASVYYQDGTSWEKIAPPSSEAAAVSIAELSGTDVYAVYEVEDSGSIADTVYKLDTAAFQWQNDANTSSIAGSGNLDFINVDGDQSILFISRRSGDTAYDVYSYDGTSLNQLNSSSLSVPVNGAAVLTSTYYLTASNNTSYGGSSALYSSDGTASSLTDLTATASTSIDFTKAIGGISENSLKDTLFLSRKDGYLYKSTDGTTWNEVAAGLEDSFGDTAELGDMCAVNYNGSDYLIISADNGYFEMNLSAGTAPELPSATAVNFDTYDLSQETVFSLYTETDKIYLGSSEGLWLSNYDGGIILDQE